MSRSFFITLSLAFCFGCGGEDLVINTEHDAWDLSYEEVGDAGVEEDAEDVGLVEEIDAGESDQGTRERPQRSAWCEEKLKRDCRELNFAVLNGFVEPELYYYLCHGPGRDRYQC